MPAGLTDDGLTDTVHRGRNNSLSAVCSSHREHCHHFLSRHRDAEMNTRGLIATFLRSHKTIIIPSTLCPYDPLPPSVQYSKCHQLYANCALTAEKQKNIFTICCKLKCAEVRIIKYF